MSEQTMARQICYALRALDPVRIEGANRPGIADVECRAGWVELKWRRRWPRGQVPVQLHHFTQQQRAWLRSRWCARGGGAFVLLQVNKEWLLFSAPAAAAELGYAPRERLYSIALGCWSPLNSKELIQCLLSNRAN